MNDAKHDDQDAGCYATLSEHFRSLLCSYQNPNYSESPQMPSVVLLLREMGRHSYMNSDVLISQCVNSQRMQSIASPGRGCCCF